VKHLPLFFDLALLNLFRPIAFAFEHTPLAGPYICRHMAPSRGQALIQNLRGRGEVAMSTDEIMALTRPIV